eukprot:8652130-Pyramimonas_sp.AAC.1
MPWHPRKARAISGPRRAPAAAEAHAISTSRSRAAPDFYETWRPAKVSSRSEPRPFIGSPTLARNS